MNKTLLLISVVIIIGGVIWFIERGKEISTVDGSAGENIETGIIASHFETGKNVGDKAPLWRLESVDGSIVALSELQGKPVLLDFFADWCPFCHTEFPFIENAHQMYQDEGLVVLGIHRTDTESIEQGVEFAREEAGATFTLLKDIGGDVYGAYTSGPAMPISFFIDAHGIIRDKILGPKTKETLKNGIEKIMVQL